MRLGATVAFDDAVRLGFTAAPMAIEDHFDDRRLDSLRLQYSHAGILGAQLSSYCNLTSTDEHIRQENIRLVKQRLKLASKAGCRSVVVGGGHRNPLCPRDVFSAHPDNWTPLALDILADSCAQILADMEPGQTKLIIETWVMTPVNSPENVRKLVDKVNHPNFGILFDPVNLMNLDRYFKNGDFIRECVDVFGDSIAVVHLKDTLLIPERFTYHLSEAQAGKGNLDYKTLLGLCRHLDPDLPLLIEHLKTLKEYEQSGAFIRQVAEELGLRL